ncbi:hypothetical protein C5167_044172 [Papaver somniferum]|uniref:Uncharacterized protein n=1 Tax=Papaver somniferum TaxID=3469 RepID=A0A4Y7L7T7_PAPSO|nr:hypothetical protein C5167_044172 [Papaver somniferum]
MEDINKQAGLDENGKQHSMTDAIYVNVSPTKLHRSTCRYCDLAWNLYAATTPASATSPQCQRGSPLARMNEPPALSTVSGWSRGNLNEVV